MTDEEQSAEPTKPINFLDVIKDLPGAPNQVIIDEWKARYGDIYFSGFSETECYIWRALSRKEYRDMQIKAQIAAASKPDIDPKNIPALTARITSDITQTFSDEEEMVSRCLLWPKLTPEELTFKAGIVPTLLEQIQQNSYFVTPQQAQMLVLKI